MVSAGTKTVLIMDIGGGNTDLTVLSEHRGGRRVQHRGHCRAHGAGVMQYGHEVI
jgi:molecular chaperone DnaK (HSP70)